MVSMTQIKSIKNTIYVELKKKTHYRHFNLMAENLK